MKSHWFCHGVFSDLILTVGAQRCQFCSRSLKSDLDLRPVLVVRTGSRLHRRPDSTGHIRTLAGRRTRILKPLPDSHHANHRVTSTLEQCRPNFTTKRKSGLLVVEPIGPARNALLRNKPSILRAFARLLVAPAGVRAVDSYDQTSERKVEYVPRSHRVACGRRIRPAGVFARGQQARPPPPAPQRSRAPRSRERSTNRPEEQAASGAHRLAAIIGWQTGTRHRP